MTNTNDDLWPVDLAVEPTDKAPLLILREQAAKLGEKTSNIIEGVVTADPNADGESLDVRLSIVAPALGGYEYVLLRLVQPPDLYPVSLEFEGKGWVANEERGFKQYLGSLFNSARTRKIISNLIAQSKNS
ncbi:MAG: hypothetical protein WCI11_02345 [Candidatus Methylumidiphilus sp.]|nr:hypothetical protein [Pseudomonadota bacterium]